MTLKYLTRLGELLFITGEVAALALLQGVVAVPVAACLIAKELVGTCASTTCWK